MKRLMTLLLALVMLIGMTSFAEDEARPVVTALIATSQLPAETNTILTELCERTGIDFRPTMVENTSYSQKYNTLAAAGTLPDIVAFSGYSQAMELIEHGVLLPLNDLLEEYGQEIIANHGSLLYDNLAVVDGKVYGLINGGGRYNMLMVRQDWLDALGLDVPTTTDEFLEVLRAFTFDDPDGDGEADTLGYAATMQFMATMTCVLSAYGVPYGRPVQADGQVVPYFMHPNYLQAIEFFRTMYQEGLMEPDFITIPNMSCLEKLWNGTYGFYYGDPIGTTNNWFPGRYTEDPKPVMTYTTIENEEGVGCVVKPVYENFIGITSSCKNPEAAMQLLNYITSVEGNQLTYAGIEGVHWAWKEEGSGIVYLDKYADSTAHRDDGGYMYWPCLRMGGMERQILTPVTQYGYALAEEHLLDDAYIFTRPEVDKDITFDSDAMLASLIVSEGDYEAEYKAFIDEYLTNGGSTWIEEATEIYAAEN